MVIVMTITMLFDLCCKNAFPNHSFRRFLAAEKDSNDAVSFSILFFDFRMSL